MQKTKLTIFLTVIFLALFGVVGVASAASVYVDQTLGADCISGDYSTTNRLCNGTDGAAYRTIQSAIVAMSGGDDIYIRGGTYQENGGFTLSCNDCAALDRRSNIEIPKSKNGTSANWSSIQSYPGEWAVIVGDNLHQEFPEGQHAVLGHYGTDKLGLHDIKYWKFERLEISGGSNSGLHINGGPFIVRYSYFHDNYRATGAENPAAIVGMVIQNSIFEYNWFKNNGCSTGSFSADNCANIAIFADYQYINDTFNIDHANKNNTIRYNYFDGGHIGYKDKASQFLGTRTGCPDACTTADMTNKDQGNKIHHNIFVNEARALSISQDFAQVYNNISDGGIIYFQEPGSTVRPIYYGTFYNNTVIGSKIKHSVAYASPYQPINEHLKWWAVNNIVDGFTNGWDSASITSGYRMVATGGTLDMSEVKIDRNYIYRPGSTDHYIAGRGAGVCSDFLTTDEFNICYSATNYTNSTAGLYVGATGADKHTTNGSFVLNGATTIANGGIGGPHPYLSGVTLPSYIGATNPSDNAWVAGVLGLASVATLQAGTASDPSWIEGSGAVPDTTPPSAPQGLVVN